MFNYKTPCMHTEHLNRLRKMLASGFASQYLGCFMLYWYNKSKQQKENERESRYFTIGHEQMSCNKQIWAACVLFFFICFRTY